MLTTDCHAVSSNCNFNDLSQAPALSTAHPWVYSRHATLSLAEAIAYRRHRHGPPSKYCRRTRAPESVCKVRALCRFQNPLPLLSTLLIGAPLMTNISPRQRFRGNTSC